MTEHAYPPNAGFFETPLPDIMLRQQERLEAAEKKAERYDLALCAVQRTLSLEIAQGNRLVSVGMLLDTLGAAAQYGACGLRGRTIDDSLRDLEAELRGPS